MWFEILPGAGIIFVMLSIPGYAFYGLNKLVNDNGYHRSMYNRWERLTYLRDVRVAGDPYKLNGLDQIKD